MSKVEFCGSGGGVKVGVEGGMGVFYVGEIGGDGVGGHNEIKGSFLHCTRSNYVVIFFDIFCTTLTVVSITCGTEKKGHVHFGNHLLCRCSASVSGIAYIQGAQYTRAAAIAAMHTTTASFPIRTGSMSNSCPISSCP